MEEEEPTSVESGFVSSSMNYSSSDVEQDEKKKNVGGTNIKDDCEDDNDDDDASDSLEPPEEADGRYLQSFQRDVKLIDLLSDISAFDVEKALAPLPMDIRDIYNSCKTSNTSASASPTRTREEETSDPAPGGGNPNSTIHQPEEIFANDLDEAYYLAQGRPLMAFHVHLEKEKAAAKAEQEKSQQRNSTSQQEQEQQQNQPSSQLSHARKMQLHRIAKSVALHNLLHEGVVSSAVCLLELCQLDTEMLRVDVYQL